MSFWIVLAAPAIFGIVVLIAVLIDWMTDL